MKRYSIIFFLASFLGVTLFSACEEEATLDGATEVYITIDLGKGHQCERKSDRDPCLLVDRR